MIPLCEFRVPTYKRPNLLIEALQSLQSQTLPNWTAVVFDDSPDQEGSGVVAHINDSRIIYRPNSTRLGCAGNLDQAFQTRPYLGGQFACVLEDDNLLKPKFLESNAKEVSSKNVLLLLRNQEVKVLSGNERLRTGKTTRGWVLREGNYSPMALRASLFLCEGISNGGLFWNCRANSNLQVGPLVSDAGLQEYCRTLRITESVAFASEPLAIWTEMTEELSLRCPAKNRTFGRGVQSIKRFLLRNFGASLALRAVHLAREAKLEIECHRSLADALYFRSLLRLPKTPKSLLFLGKTLAKLALVRDPLKAFLETIVRDMSAFDAGV